MDNLDKEEKELIDSVNRGEWESVENFEEEKKRYQSIAMHQLKYLKAIKFIFYLNTAIISISILYSAYVCLFYPIFYLSCLASFFLAVLSLFLYLYKVKKKSAIKNFYIITPFFYVIFWIIYFIVLLS